MCTVGGLSPRRKVCYDDDTAGVWAAVVGVGVVVGGVGSGFGASGALVTSGTFAGAEAGTGADADIGAGADAGAGADGGAGAAKRAGVGGWSLVSSLVLTGCCGGCCGCCKTGLLSCFFSPCRSPFTPSSPVFLSPPWGCCWTAGFASSFLNAGLRNRSGTPRAADVPLPTQAPNSLLQWYSPRHKRWISRYA